MKQAIGVKLINFQPMTRQQYNDFRGWTLPADENGADEGYLVEYVDGGKANTAAYAGYVSWSPKDVFDRAYRVTTGLSFGLAIEAMKAGKRVARAGWNGKGMWIALGAGNAALEAEKFWNPHTRSFAEQNGGTADVQPCFLMKTAQDNIQMGWTPSQSDVLAEDWAVVL